jgi:hypothetical protein
MVAACIPPKSVVLRPTIRLADEVGPEEQVCWLAVETSPADAVVAVNAVPLVWPELALHCTE